MNSIPFLLAGSFVAMASVVAPQEPADKKPVEPLKNAPRVYYREHCQRCHGVDGTNFIPGYAQKETREKLRADVKRMAEGAGESPLKDFDIEVQTEYAALASAMKPFLAWTSRDGLVIKGEATADSEVKAMVGDKPIQVEVDDDNNWTIRLESEDQFKSLKVIATMEKQSTELRPSEKAYSVMPKPKSSG